MIMMIIIIVVVLKTVVMKFTAVLCACVVMRNRIGSNTWCCHSVGNYYDDDVENRENHYDQLVAVFE